MTEQSLKNYKNWLIYLSHIDSTNNYAMGLLSDGMAEHGQVVWTKHQSAGKGQRGKVWTDNPGDSLLMSMILTENLDDLSIFELNKYISLSVCQVLQSILPSHTIRIKWPNDIYIADKKACGILIENGFRGNRWSHAIIGIGVNIFQNQFPSSLSNATSLYIEQPHEYDIVEIIESIRETVLQYVKVMPAVDQEYLQSLYKINEHIQYMMYDSATILEGVVVGVNGEGQLLIAQGDSVHAYSNGEIVWIHD